MSLLREPPAPAVGAEPIDQALADTLAHWLGCTEPWLRATLAVLSEALRDGHTCLELPRWAGQVYHPADAEAEPLPLPALADWQARLAELDLGPEAEAPLVLDGARLYLRRYWRFETELAQDLRARLSEPPTVDLEAARGALERLFPSSSSGAETDWQKIAAANALLERVSLIAGGPGTGKTHTVTRLLALLVETGLAGPEGRAPQIHLAAPTGKAAQRLAEAMGQARAALRPVLAEGGLDALPETATTLHRLLGVRGDGIGFRHSRENPLTLEALVVDELSMVDLPLMARLFRALPAECRVIFLGDADQLPSVAAGSVLGDLVTRPHPGYSPERRRTLAALGAAVPEAGPEAAAAAEKTEAADHLSLLRQSRRFASGGGIGRLAGHVIAGEAEAAAQLLSDSEAVLQWWGSESLGEALTSWIEAYYAPITEAPDLATAFARLGAFRLLSPLRSGPCGVEGLNERILRTLNPQRRRFFTGQPVMVTRNHYALGLYNGDIGLLWPDETGQLLAWFPEAEGFRPLAPGRLPAHETVYAMTIHKTQGSEFDQVALVLPEQPAPILTRELLYTGLTRAREALVVVGPEAVWQAGVRQRVERHSGLGERVFSGQ